MSLESNIWKSYVYNAFRWIQFVAPIYAIFFLAKPLSLIETGLIVATIMAVTQVLFEIPSGVFADMFGLKFSLALSALCNIFAVLLFVNSAHFWFLALGSAFTGLSYSFHSGADSALLYNTLKKLQREKEYKKIRGRQHAISYGVTALTSLVGAWLYTFDVNLPFYLGGALVIVALITALSMVEPYKQAGKKVSASYAHLKSSLQYALRTPLVLKFIGFSLFTWALMLVAWKTFYQPYLILTGLDVVYFGIAYAAFRGLSAFTSFFAHRVESKLGIKACLLLIPLLWGGTFIAAAQVLHPLSFLILFIIHIVLGVSRVVTDEYFNRVVHTHHRATLISIKAMVSITGLAIFTPLFAFLGNESPLSAFTLIGVTILLFGGLLGLSIKVKDIHRHEKTIDPTQTL